MRVMTGMVRDRFVPCSPGGDGDNMTHNLRRIVFWVVLLAFVAAGLQADESPESACPLIPVPKVYHDTGRRLVLAEDGKTAIVFGARAVDPERYAAGRLQTLVERRFRRRLPVLQEDDVPDEITQVLLVGQRTTNAWLGRLCDQAGIDLSETSPGEDGFVIQTVEDGARQVVLVGGSNAPGAIYGQNALFDLFDQQDGRVELRLASVRDWPSIRWRGRPHWRLRVHLAPGVFDSYARYRLNFTDLRDAGTPDGYAAMGFSPGFDIDVPTTRQVLDEAHHRGMFVYGTVSCGVKSDQYDAALRTFAELIELGVDGIWISLDDSGAGEDAPQIVLRALALGAEHGMTGRRTAITQPVGSYNYLDTEFNRTTAAIPEYAAAQWFFTRVPCQEDLDATRRLGLKLPPAWWHNLFSIRGGFLHNASAVQSLRADGRPAYLDMQPLRSGWGSPGWEQLRDAAEYTDTVLLWGLYDGWPEEYQVGVMGIWAWNPAAHDWPRTRRAIYADVYGPGQADMAAEFDDTLRELKDLFEMPVRHFRPNKGWPPQLKKQTDRPEALELLDQLESLRAVLHERAPAETLLDPERLNEVYLEPMQATLAYARKMAELDYPEYTLGSSFEQLAGELYETHGPDEAEATLAPLREQARSQLATVAETLDGLKGIDEYVAFWSRQVDEQRDWQEYLAQRRARMKTTFESMLEDGFSRCLVDERLDDEGYAVWLEGLASAPPGCVLAEVPAGQWLAQPPRWRGPWSIGPLEWRYQPSTVIAFPRRTASQAGDHAEVRAELPRPVFTGRLQLDLFVNDTKIDPKYPEYRYQELWINDRMVWQEDITVSRAGREWLTLDVTALATPESTLAIRFRVIDRRPVSSYGSVTFLGPLRLRVVE